MSDTINAVRVALLITCIAVFSVAAHANEANTHPARDPYGAVCIGPNLSKVLEPSMKTNLFIQIDNLPKKLFGISEGVILFKDLDLNKKHHVRLYEGDKQFESWSFDFKKLKTNFVIIWKSAGYWKTIPVGGEKCMWPPPSCPSGKGC